MTVNGELLPSIEDIDSSIADNISVTSADDSIYAFSEGVNLTESPADVSHSSIPNPAMVPNGQDGDGDLSSEVEEDEEDSTGDEDGSYIPFNIALQDNICICYQVQITSLVCVHKKANTHTHTHSVWLSDVVFWLLVLLQFRGALWSSG